MSNFKFHLFKYLVKFTEQITLRLWVTYYRLPFTDYLLPITSYRLPLTDHLLPITSYRLPITSYRSPITLRENTQRTHNPIHIRERIINMRRHPHTTRRRDGDTVSFIQFLIDFQRRFSWKVDDDNSRREFS